MRKTIWEIIKEVKGWGVTALLALVVFGIFAFKGYWLFAGIALGVFFTRNWDIVVEIFNEKIFK